MRSITKMALSRRCGIIKSKPSGSATAESRGLDRLIISVSQDNPKQYIKTLITVYNSWITDKIDDYNSSFYYDSADCIYKSYLIGKPL